MDIFQSFDQYLTASTAQIPVFNFILDLILTGILSMLVNWVYIHYGNTISNRRAFGKNLFMISMTTMVIISVVKSSLALSLGLVGALSIIRFRTAIKEPEELAYLFLAISIGLGFGANQGTITIISLVVILSTIIISKRFSNKDTSNNSINLMITASKPTKMNLDNIISILDKHCNNIAIKRFDDKESIFEASFLVEFSKYEKFLLIKNEMDKIDNKVSVSYLENSNINIG
jgi:hypothetical protein